MENVGELKMHLMSSKDLSHGSRNKFYPTKTFSTFYLYREFEKGKKWSKGID
jgi:hypothetical protein